MIKQSSLTVSASDLPARAKYTFEFAWPRCTSDSGTIKAGSILVTNSGVTLSKVYNNSSQGVKYNMSVETSNGTVSLECKDWTAGW